MSKISDVKRLFCVSATSLEYDENVVKFCAELELLISSHIKYNKLCKYYTAETDKIIPR